ncbi:sensor domain-containing diguanylate cyclase [Gloeothece verrucosa]|uniref:Diguanylate cyclase with PAS/PAC sensor n=1 Tax=Gloeothece verrucosa (strain PCC 7822) TaxID=497965 RepID=E0UHU0_GLOV7|nr:GGDEF domain-containing protein [Gloeothece verrucosa]ADN14470.1 diguanylate cyclase with PAS/PAC sensor [Gloeothece verrucosa PCC 7822]
MSPDFYEKLVDNLHDGVYYVDLKKNITYWNQAAERITGYTREQVLGSKCSDNILRHIDEQGRELCIIGCPLVQTLRDGKIRELDVYLHHQEGYRVPVSVRIAPITDEQGVIVGAVELFLENSSKLALLKELESIKGELFFDPLTHLGNRKLIRIELEHKFEHLYSYSIPFGILFIDLDDFKQINDNYGHNIGDKILIMAAKTLSNILRNMDIVARWGGDEFLVIIPNIDSKHLKIIANRISSFIKESWLIINDKKVGITASIGGTMAKKEDTIESLIERADREMYKSKMLGRNRVSLSEDQI